MMTKPTFKRWHFLWMLLAVIGNLSAQNEGREARMKLISNELIVNSSPEKVWQTLASFGNVSTFLSTIDEGSAINGSVNKAVLGAERESIIPNGVNNIIYKERIIDIEVGAYYTLEVFESENFPLKKMYVTYGVNVNKKGQTVLFSTMEYKLNSGLLTRLMKGKMDKRNMDHLIAYKFHIETGEENADIITLRKRFYKGALVESDKDYIVINDLSDK